MIDQNRPCSKPAGAPLESPADLFKTIGADSPTPSSVDITQCCPHRQQRQGVALEQRRLTQAPFDLHFQFPQFLMHARRIDWKPLRETDARLVSMHAIGQRRIAAAFREVWSAGDRVNLNRPVPGGALDLIGWPVRATINEPWPTHRRTGSSRHGIERLSHSPPPRQWSMRSGRTWTFAFHLPLSPFRAGPRRRSPAPIGCHCFCRIGYAG
jgi:hypothetical protein